MTRADWTGWMERRSDLSNYLRDMCDGDCDEESRLRAAKDVQRAFEEPPGSAG